MCEHNSSTKHCADNEEPGRTTVSFQDDNDSHVFSLADTELAKSKKSVEIFWSYPMNTLTLTIETPFTHQGRPYSISLDNKGLSASIKHLYRLLDGQETEIPINDERIVEESDSNYQVILKFQAPSEMSTYGVFIKYGISPN